ncbi:hypothetical protein PLESTB_001241900 [Pleodorina starrii]|uniref:Guanylate cyclase domain-containing protein n=1 Tax=Pleodorina starrii TaxID=330485 RepID=A0A9W6BT39_9CHLO|nr:hypothetical protein PLESTB_001241900 [Pleodorina starrii]
MSTMGDVATGAIANCGLPFYEPSTATALDRTVSTDRPNDRPFRLHLGLATGDTQAPGYLLPVKLLHPNIVITNTTLILLTARMTASMQQYPLGVDVIDSVRWTQAPLREFDEEHPNGTREAWFMDPVLTADMADEPYFALQDMSQLVLQDKNLNVRAQWNGYGTFFRRFASVYDGKVVGLPVSAAIMLLYYRRDFFNAQNIPVPATWEEVVDIAERYNGTDLDGTGRGAWGFCMSRQPRCYNGYTFQTIQVPFMQSEGTSQGFHFDPETKESLVNSTGTRRAAELYRRLSRYTAPTEPVACLPVSLAFVWGNCLMAVGTTLHFKYATFNNSLNNMTRVRGKTGITILPGSFEVMNRTTGQMNGTKAWVNAAPYAGRGAFTYALNRHREPHLQYMAYRLCARRVYADAMWPSVLSATAETTPVRTEMVDPANVGRYTAAGYDREDTLLFMKAVSETMEHQNIALNLRIFGALEYYFAVDTASVALSDTDGDIDQILARAQAEVVRLYRNTSVEWLKQRYWKSIERKLQMPPPPPDLPSGGMDSKARVGIAVGVGVGGGLLLIGVAVLVVAVLRPAFISAQQRKAYVPVASAECTLVVTDMEGSTNLWEAFPGDVMATALQAHDAVVRKVLVRHRGYESATEAELMAADWPPVLLTDSDICRPVYAAPRAATKDGQTLFRRSGNLRPAAASRTSITPSATPAAASTGFSHINSIASAFAAAAAAAAAASRAGGGTAPAAAPATLTAGRTRSGALQLRALQPQQTPQYSSQQHNPHHHHYHHQQQQQQQQQLLEGRALLGPAMSLGTSLGEVPEQYVAAASSLGSMSSLGGSGMVASGALRVLSPQAKVVSGDDGGGGCGGGGGPAVMAAIQQQQQQQPRRLAIPLLPPRVSQLLAPSTDRAFQQSRSDCGGDNVSAGGGSGGSGSGSGGGGGGGFTFTSHVASAAEPASGILRADVARSPAAARASSTPQAPPYAHPQSQHAQQPVRSQQQSLLGRPSNDDPGVSGQLVVNMTAGGEPCNSMAGVSTQLSGFLATGLSASGIPASGTMAGAAAAPPQLGAVGDAAASGVVAAAAAGGDGSGGGGGGGRAKTCSFGSEAAAAWQVLEGHAPGAVTVYRGLRIRVGLHAGVHPGELARNRASSRITFSGLAVRMAKAVSDAAKYTGGMVVLSDTSASQLLGSPEVAALLAGEGTEVWHLGRVKLADDLRDVEMFQMVTPSLAPRLALQQPLRIKSQLLPGVLSAPAGCVALVRLHVSGLALLRASEPELAAEVAAVLEALLLQSLPALGGYLSEARQGGTEGISVAFPDCLRAVAWALAVQADMMAWEWSPELLRHEAFETIAIDAPSSFSQALLCGAEELPVAAAPSSAAAATAAAVTAATTNTEIAEPSTSKASYPSLYGSPQATSCTGCKSPAAVSFISQPAAGPSIRPITAATATAAAAASGNVGGGGGSFTFPADRPPVSAASDGHGGAVVRTGSFSLQPTVSVNRDGAMDASFSARMSRPRSQRYLPWGSAARARIMDVESQAPSLLSPLQPPPERPKAGISQGPVGVDTVAAAAAAAARRRAQALQINLPSFMRRARGTQEMATEEAAGGEGEAQLCDPAVGQGGRGVEAAVERAEGGQMHGNSRPTAGVETLRLGAAPTPSVATAAAAAAATVSIALTAVTGTAAGCIVDPAADTDAVVAAAASATAATAATATAGIDIESARPWYGEPEPVSPLAAAPMPAHRAASGPSPAATARARLLLATAGCTANSSPPPPSSTVTASGMNPRGQVLFRGPRIKAVVDFGGVSTEICRTTGRLLYRGRMAKQLAKMIAAAKWGQVICTAAVYGQAGKAAPQVGISMAPVAGTGTQAAGAGRRKPPAASASRTGPGAHGVAIRPSSIVTAASGGNNVSGVAAQQAASATEPHDATAAGSGKRPGQYYLCTMLAQRRVEMAVAPSPVVPRGDVKPPPSLLPPPSAMPPADALRPFTRPAALFGIRSKPEL